MRVNYGQTVHGEAEISAVVDVLRTSTQMGRHVRSMQSRVAALFEKRHGIMVNSGSSANYLAIELLNLPPGSEVITPALTFVTTAAPIVRNRLVPAFVDVAEATYNIDVDAIDSMITSNTKAMMIPSLIGNLPDWDKIREIADAHDLKIIEDSCDTLGATLRGLSTGLRSDISTTSFYGSHVINAAGNGGMLCLNDEELARRALLLRSWGRTSSLFAQSEAIESRFDVEVDGIPYDAKFVFEELGYNFEPSEVGAAFGLVQLDKLDSNILERQRNFKRHLAYFADHEEFFILPREMAHSRTGWLAFPLTIRDHAPFTRREMQIYLEERDIQTRPVFTGNILRQPAMANVKSRLAPGGYPVADAVMRGGILLACHHGLDEAQLHHMHNVLDAFLSTFRSKRTASPVAA
jgi:CDP-6-deoxy-D-xylo-4-hexulose-3-dehydrase